MEPANGSGDGKGTRESASGHRKAPNTTTDLLTPGDPVDTMSDSAFAELVAEMVDGPGKVHAIMEMFGLARCKNTRVAGLSGGEKKRLSSVELMQGDHRVLIMDEISTGLV
jgi:ABC-type multidrug transport system ATPase subunit